MPVFTFPTPSPVSLRSDIYITGDLTVTASSTDKTVVRAEPRDPSSSRDIKAAESITAEQDGDQIVVKSPKPSILGWITGNGITGAVTITVTLPTSSSTQLNLANGAITLVGDLAEVRAKTANGHVKVASAEQVTVHTNNGDIELGTVRGVVDAHTNSGTIEVAEAQQGGKLKTNNGKIHVKSAGAQDTKGDAHPLNVFTSNGAIKVDVAIATSELTATTLNGAIALRDVTASSIEATTNNGTVYISIPKDTWASVNTKCLAGKVVNNLRSSGDGKGTQIKATSLSGDITLEHV